MRKLLLSLMFLSLLIGCTDTRVKEELAIIPVPVETVDLDGVFKLNGSTVVYAPADNAELTKAAQTIAATLGKTLGQTLTVTTEKPAKGIIIETMDGASEEYALSVTKSAINIKASGYAGAFYALQTMLQMMPAAVYGDYTAESYEIQCVEIKDYPRFAWRGVMLDVSRHFFPIERIYKLVDAMAMQKQNRLHLHLTDAAGWRLEIEQYPALTEVGAWRRGPAVFGEDVEILPVKPDNAYGGFYTKAQMRELVTYAAERAITIVPEIEMPGHTSFTAYPEYSCNGKHNAGAYCAGNDKVYEFLQNILDEVLDVFPSQYIHIGGDEVGKGDWKRCPKCQARMRAEKLKNEEELQSYFVHRMQSYVESKGRTMIGWDEIMEGGLQDGSVVMAWRGDNIGVEAAKMGHDVIMTPTTYCYLDYYQNNPEVEPEAIGGYVNTRKVYGFNPASDTLSADVAKNIIGIQGNLWTEYIFDADHVEYMYFPRLAAIAETGWSPNSKKDWNDFNRRLDVEMKRYDAMGINYHKGVDAVYFNPTIGVDGVVKVALESEIFNSQILFTIDGTEPNLNSQVYKNLLELRTPLTIKAIIAKNGEIVSKAVSERFLGMHKAMGKSVKYNIPYSTKYKAQGDVTLNNGMTGSLDPSDGMMQGVESVNMDVVFDLGTNTEFETVAGSFFQGAGSWIFLPRELIVYTSDDGETFTEVGKTVNNEFKRQGNAQYRKIIKVEGNFKGRYVRVVAVNGPTPEGFPAPEIPNWIFCDEIFIY